MSDYGSKLQAALAETGVTGASFAYWDGKTLHTAAAGLRNSVTGDPVTTDTVMHIGSITKIVNTVLMMQLVDDGKIALDDPVTKYLPDFRIRDKAALAQLTCAMLVNHTSGIDCDWLPEYGPDQERIVDTVDRCADLEQLFAPGKYAAYCNVATVVAGHLTQTLRGTSWYTLVRKRIYEPLGMERALVDPLDVPRFRASIGDLTDQKTGKMVQTKRPFLAPSFAPAGSTQMMAASDLVIFARAMLGGGEGTNGARILSAASAALMAKPTAAFVLPAWQIGLGWMILPGGVLSHGGSGPGVASQLYADPKSGRVLVLLTNCDKGSALASPIIDPILESWTGIKTASPERRKGAVDSKPYVGTYESNMQRYRVLPREGGLALRISAKMDVYDNFSDKDEPPPPTPLHPVGNDTFEIESDGPVSMRSLIQLIDPDAGGRMRYLASGVRLLRRVD